MAKLLENTYRHVNIALVNEMAQFCHELDIDLWDAIRWRRPSHSDSRPSTRVRGWAGIASRSTPTICPITFGPTGQAFRFVELAQEINAGMPAYVVRRARTSSTRTARPSRDRAAAPGRDLQGQHRRPTGVAGGPVARGFRHWELTSPTGIPSWTVGRRREPCLLTAAAGRDAIDCSS